MIFTNSFFSQYKIDLHIFIHKNLLFISFTCCARRSPMYSHSSSSRATLSYLQRKKLSCLSLEDHFVFTSGVLPDGKILIKFGCNDIFLNFTFIMKYFDFIKKYNFTKNVLESGLPRRTLEDCRGDSLEEGEQMLPPH